MGEVAFVFPPSKGNRAAFAPHLGVAYLRAALSRVGITSFQYCTPYPGTSSHVVSEILGVNPKIVGFTVYESNYGVCLNLASQIKTQRPHTWIVFGGPTATFLYPRILFESSPVDVCVLGEADETGPVIFTSLLEAEEQLPGDFRAISGLAFQDGGKLFCSGLAPLAAGFAESESPLDALPSPYETGVLPDGRTGILTGRGCNQNCVYCSFAALGRRRIRLHSLERVMSELLIISNDMKRKGEHYTVNIHDDTFSLLVDRAKELCEMIASRDLGLHLSCITRADRVDGELLRLMKAAGFTSIAFGLESAVPSVLRAIGKVRPPEHPNTDLDPEHHFLEQVRLRVNQAHDLGFIVGVSIILGLPTETPEDGAATLDFVKKLPVDFYMHNYLEVFEGTPLSETHGRYGISTAEGPLGLPMTMGYSYNPFTLVPSEKCVSLREAEDLRTLVCNTLFSCVILSGPNAPHSVQS